MDLGRDGRACRAHADDEPRVCGAGHAHGQVRAPGVHRMGTGRPAWIALREGRKVFNRATIELTISEAFLAGAGAVRVGRPASTSSRIDSVFPANTV